MIETADVVIIGGGVHGCRLAFHLATARAGRVVLLEKQHLASGPTGQSGAMIRPLFDQRVYVDLAIASTRMFEQWDQMEAATDPIQTVLRRRCSRSRTVRTAGAPDAWLGRRLFVRPVSSPRR